MKTSIIVPVVIAGVLICGAVFAWFQFEESQGREAAQEARYAELRRAQQAMDKALLAVCTDGRPAAQAPDVQSTANKVRLFERTHLASDFGVLPWPARGDGSPRDHLGPKALGEAHLVACLEVVEDSVKSCFYGEQGVARWARRGYRVTLRAARTAAIVTQTTHWGAPPEPPDACPEWMEFSNGSPNLPTPDGREPNLSDVLDALEAHLDE